MQRLSYAFMHVHTQQTHTHVQSVWFFFFFSVVSSQTVSQHFAVSLRLALGTCSYCGSSAPSTRMECAYMVGKIKPGREETETDVQDLCCERQVSEDKKVKKKPADVWTQRYRMSTVGVKHTSKKNNTRKQWSFGRLTGYAVSLRGEEIERKCSRINKRIKLLWDKEKNLKWRGTDRAVEVAPKCGLFVQTWAPCLVFPSYLWRELYTVSYITLSSRLQTEWLSSMIVNLHWCCLNKWILFYRMKTSCS